MNIRNIIIHSAHFLLYLLLQVMIFKNVALLGVAFGFVYIGFLLFLPFNTARVWQIFIGFATGLILDVFYDSLGIHAAACVLLMYLRPWWTSRVTPSGGYELINLPKLKTLGFQWFFTYAFPLVLVHHLAIFFIEVGGAKMFFFTLTKALSSSAFTFALLVVLQNLFYKEERAF